MLIQILVVFWYGVSSDRTNSIQFSHFKFYEITENEIKLALIFLFSLLYFARIKLTVVLQPADENQLIYFVNKIFQQSVKGLAGPFLTIC